MLGSGWTDESLLGKIRRMLALRFESVSSPIVTPEVFDAIARLIVRLEPMGLLPKLRKPVEVDIDLLRALARKLSDHGIARAALAQVFASPPDPARLRRALEAVLRDLEQTPIPETEWSALVEILDADLLGALVGVSASSVRRYATGERKTPDDAAERLHFVALVVGELAGAYNDVGIRRWFGRPRTALGGKTPRSMMHRNWTPDGPGPKRVRELAASLSGSPAT